MKTGIELITEERNEQIVKHGRSVEQDVELNSEDQLSFAAVSLVSQYDGTGVWAKEVLKRIDSGFWTPAGWDGKIFKKMMNKPHIERLIIAGALIAAEIDRLQRLKG